MPLLACGWNDPRYMKWRETYAVQPVTSDYPNHVNLLQVCDYL